MNPRIQLACLVAIAMGLALLAGCEGSGSSASNRDELVLYPPAPDAPRFQVLTTFDSAENIVRKKSGGFSDFVLGKQEDRPGDEKEGQVGSPFAVAVHQGRLYVCDVEHPKVRVYDFLNESYLEIGGPRELVRPVGIHITADGTKYVSDAGLRRVAVFDANDKFVKHLGDPKTCAPISVLRHGDELFVVDQLGAELEVWNLEGDLLRIIASKGNQPQSLQRPVGIAINSSNELYVTDMMAAQAKIYTLDGKFIRTLGGPGDTPGKFARPKGIAIDAKDRVYICGAQFDTVQVFSPEGQLLIVLHDQSESWHGMLQPSGVAIDTSSMPFFQKFVKNDLKAEFLVFVVNQFGRYNNKISVLAYVGD